MQRIDFFENRPSLGRAFAVLAFVLAFAVGCGPIGDKGGDKATETAVSMAGSTQSEATTYPTGPTAPTATEVPVATVTNVTLATPTVAQSVNPTGPFSTPLGTAEAGFATPTVGVLKPGDGTPAEGAPATAVSTATAEQGATNSSGSDGTSGATPEPGATYEAVSDAGTAVPEASPGAFFVREETTPDLSKAPENGNLASAKPLTVDSCNPPQVTPMPGQPLPYVTLFELNFRSGPGSDCGLIGDGPVAEGTDVQVIGWPVSRKGDADNVWIQVTIGNQTGWLVIDGLEPSAP